MIVFCNGVFDVLHYGHFKLFEHCRKLAGYDGKVVAALNSDDSTRRLKGENRPIFRQTERAFALSCIKHIDEVIIFDADTPLEVIKDVRPDIIVKGGDYRPEEVVGHDICKVEIFKFVEGYSTTNTLKNLGHW